MENHYKHIHVRPQPNAFGAAITGLSIDKPLPAPVLEEVKRAWAEHSVVYFPDQPLTHSLATLTSPQASTAPVGVSRGYLPVVFLIVAT